MYSTSLGDRIHIVISRSLCSDIVISRFQCTTIFCSFFLPRRRPIPATVGGQVGFGVVLRGGSERRQFVDEEIEEEMEEDQRYAHAERGKVKQEIPTRIITIGSN